MKLALAFFVGAAAATSSYGQAKAADSEVDPLSLESAPAAADAKPAASYKLYVEGAVGRVDRRHGLEDQTLGRLSIDYSQTFKLSDAWRFTLSDRLDHVSAPDAGAEKTLNSLREAYAGWRDQEGTTLVDLGRVNLRHGTGYGYNPTDFFRDFAVRAANTVDPFALRENRLGTVMVRAQRLWSGGALSGAYAPKLASQPSGKSFDLDLGATNSSHRGLASLSSRFSDKLSTQTLLYAEQGKGAQFGINLTALVTDAAVLHGEWTYGRDFDLLKQAQGVLHKRNAHRVVAGGTYTTASRLSMTAEFEYNGFAATSAEWDQAAASGPAALLRYLLLAQVRQDNAARTSWVVYATQRDLLKKNLDLTMLLRANAQDSSWMGWIELRNHWEKFDGIVQLQWSRGDPLTEHGLPPAKQMIQVLGAWYF